MYNISISLTERPKYHKVGLYLKRVFYFNLHRRKKYFLALTHFRIFFWKISELLTVF